MRKREALKILLAAVLAAPIPVALAQFGGGGFPGGGRGGGFGGPSGPPDRRRTVGEEFPARPLESALEELHEDLQLTVAQETSWQLYADKVRALAGDVLRERSPGQSALQLNVLQQLDRIVDAARNRLTALEEIVQAAKVLYGSLSAVQRGVANPRLANVASIPLSIGDPRPMGNFRPPTGDFRPPERGERGRD